MGLFEKLNMSESTVATIEWEMTPDLAFCTFSAKGLRDGLNSTKERVCYFFIDNWGDSPRLYLMERGVRFVNILAEITAPPELITDCLVGQGGNPPAKGNYTINDDLRKWLVAEVVEPDNSPFLHLVEADEAPEEDFGTPLSMLSDSASERGSAPMPDSNEDIRDDEVGPLVKKYNFYDELLNPKGAFVNSFADTGDDLTVVDERTELMWQRGGLELCSFRTMIRAIERLNLEGFAGFTDWRIPSLEEAMSLMDAKENTKGLHLHPCFSQEQPFIFVSARRQPTGYWFVDYKRGRLYWSSGTVPGGFCRLCRRF